MLNIIEDSAYSFFKNQRLRKPAKTTNSDTNSNEPPTHRRHGNANKQKEPNSARSSREVASQSQSRNEIPKSSNFPLECLPRCKRRGKRKQPTACHNELEPVATFTIQTNRSTKDYATTAKGEPHRKPNLERNRANTSPPSSE